MSSDWADVSPSMMDGLTLAADGHGIMIAMNTLHALEYRGLVYRKAIEGSITGRDEVLITSRGRFVLRGLKIS